MTLFGSVSKGSLVLELGIKLNLLTMFDRANFASSKANLMPMQPLGPCPKGRNAYL